MITGLHVDVKSEELKSLLEARLKYHSERIEFYESQLKKMKEVDAAMASEAAEFSKVSNRSPVESMEQAIKKHRDQTVYYKFMAEHVVANEIYRLAESDLMRLGISPNLY